MTFHWNWTRARDNEPMTMIRVQHLLTRDQLATQLIVAVEPHTYIELESEYSKQEVEQKIRRQLDQNSKDAMYWDERYPALIDGPSAEEVLAWARAQVKQL